MLMCGMIRVFFILIFLFSFQIIQAQNFNKPSIANAIQYPVFTMPTIVSVREAAMQTNFHLKLSYINGTPVADATYMFMPFISNNCN
jgi:hypothetical protein